MKGIQYVVDDRGKAKAVQIDLKQHRRLWEDFRDVLISKSRLAEPRVSLEQARARLRKLGKLR